MNGDARQLWVYGGDTRNHFRKRISFEWGKIAVGQAERNVRH
jgi:hypothetical protein